MKKAIKMTVTNTETNESYPIMSKQLPRKTEVGVAIQLKINHIGLHWFKQKFGVDLTDVKTLNALWCQKTGMPEEGIGALESWKTAEERAKWKVTLGEGQDAVDWAQAVGEPTATTKKETQSEEPQTFESVSIDMTPMAPTPQEPQEPSQQPMTLKESPIELLADTTPIINQEIVTKAVEFLKAGHDEDKVLIALTSKLNDKELAFEHLRKAREQLNPLSF